MDPSFLVSTVQAVLGVILCGIFSCTLCSPWYQQSIFYWALLLTISLPLWPLGYPSSDSYFHMTTPMASVTRSQYNTAPLGYGRTGDSHYRRPVDNSAATAWCCHVTMDQNLSRIFTKPRWKYSMKNYIRECQLEHRIYLAHLFSVAAVASDEPYTLIYVNASRTGPCLHSVE